MNNQHDRKSENFWKIFGVILIIVVMVFEKCTGIVISIGSAISAIVLLLVATIVAFLFHGRIRDCLCALFIIVAIVVIIACNITQSDNFEELETTTQASESIGTGSTESPSTEIPKTEPQSTYQDTTTQPAIEPEVNISVYNRKNDTVTLVAYGELVGQNVVWTSNDTNVATITTLDSTRAKIVACGEGSTIITAEIFYNGMYYSDDIMVSVDASLEESGSGSLKYFYHLPEGIDTTHEDYHLLRDKHSIYASQEDAITAANVGEATVKYGSENKIGYVYYHWCRGEAEASYETWEASPIESAHNRLSRSIKCKEKLPDGTEAKFIAFTCVFSDKHLSESTMEHSPDDESVWFPNYDMCYDSYWYWPTPIMECTYTAYKSTLTISVSD